MPKRDKPFVIYRGGWFDYLIVPQGMMGWTQFLVWFALLVPLVLWFIDHSSIHDGANLAYGLVMLAFGIVFWLIGGIWWMSMRANVVDVAVLRRERQRKMQRKRRQRLEKDTIDPP